MRKVKVSKSRYHNGYVGMCVILNEEEYYSDYPIAIMNKYNFTFYLFSYLLDSHYLLVELRSRIEKK